VFRQRAVTCGAQVAKEIWEVAGGTVKKIDVDIATCARAAAAADAAAAAAFGE